MSDKEKILEKLAELNTQHLILLMKDAFIYIKQKEKDAKQNALNFRDLANIVGDPETKELAGKKEREHKTYVGLKDTLYDILKSIG